MNKLTKIVLIVSLIFTMSCATDNATDELNLEAKKEQFNIDLAEIEKQLEVDKPSVDVLKKATTMFQDFVGFYPDNEKAPNYLHRASDFALITDNLPTSVKLLNKIIEKYPNYNQLESVYYNRASHVDFNMRDTVLAKQYYLEVIKKYPNSQSAIDAQTRINQHFMSEEELADMFLKKLESEQAQ